MTNAANSGGDWWKQHVDTELQSKVDKDAYSVWQASITAQLVSLATAIDAWRAESRASMEQLRVETRAAVDAIRADIKAEQDKKEIEKKEAASQRKSDRMLLLSTLVFPLLILLLTIYLASKGFKTS